MSNNRPLLDIKQSLVRIAYNPLYPSSCLRTLKVVTSSEKRKMKYNSDPMAPNAKNMSKEAATEHTVLAKKPSKRETKRAEKDEEFSENQRPMPKLDLRGNEVAHVGHSALDPSLLVGILPKNKNHLELEHGTALGSLAGSSSSMSSDAGNDAPGHKGGGAPKKTPKTKSAEVNAERSGSKLRTKPPASKEHGKRTAADVKPKSKPRDVSKGDQPANKKATKCKSSESETRLKIPSRKKLNERTASPKTKEHTTARNRSLRKVAAPPKKTGSSKTKLKPKT